jgi:MFS family permease
LGPETVTGVWTPGRRALTLGLVLTVTLVASEALAISAVMPEVEAELGDRWLYGWVSSAFFLGGLIGITVAGRAADRMHPWKPFALGLVLFSAGLVAGGAAGSMPVLVAARVLQGLGAGALPATAYVCIGRAYDDRIRPRMFALLSTAWVLPGLVGPSIAAYVGDEWSWRWVFLGLLPLVAAAGGLAVRAVQRGVPATEAEPVDEPALAGDRGFANALLVALAAGVLLGGLVLEPWYVGLPLAVAAGWALRFPYRRLTPEGVLTARAGLPATILSRGLLTAAFFSADFFVPLALRDVRGTEPWVVGVALTAATLAWTTGAWIQERRVHDVGPRVLIRAGFVGLAGAWAVAGVALAESVPVALLVLAFAITGLAMGPAYASVSVTTLALAEPGREGRASSALQLTDVLGTALGTGIAGAIVARGDDLGIELRWSLTAVFALAVAFALAGSVVAHRVPAHLPTARRGREDFGAVGSPGYVPPP